MFTLPPRQRSPHNDRVSPLSNGTPASSRSPNKITSTQTWSHNQSVRIIAIVFVSVSFFMTIKCIARQQDFITLINDTPTSKDAAPEVPKASRQQVTNNTLGIVQSDEVDLEKTPPTSPPPVVEEVALPRTPMDYDVALPRFIKGSGRVHYLPSMSHRQQPPLTYTDENLTHLVERLAEMYHENITFGERDSRPLYLYNPSLIPLSHVDSDLRNKISGTDYDLQKSQVKAMYLASYRVSTTNACHGNNSPPQTNPMNYLGLALLDEHLDIIQGSDTVVQMNGYKMQNWPQKNRDGTLRYPRQIYQDCRLGVLPALSCPGKQYNSTQQKSGLYMTCNHEIIPIMIDRILPEGNESRTTFSSHLCGEFIPLPNLYGNGLQLSLLSKTTMVSRKGKNYNFFQSNDSEYFIEDFPSGPHQVIQLNFSRGAHGMLPSDGEQIKSDAPEPNTTWLEPETFKD